MSFLILDDVTKALEYFSEQHDTHHWALKFTGNITELFISFVLPGHKDMGMLCHFKLKAKFCLYCL